MNTEQMVNVEQLCRSYLTAMESGSLEELLANFTDDATATSPIFGRQPARDFYAYIMRETSARSMTLKTIFIGASNSPQAAIHFLYTRQVGSDKPATIEVVDVFDLTEDHSKFAAVTIIYDTAPVRADFDTP